MRFDLVLLSRRVVLAVVMAFGLVMASSPAAVRAATITVTTTSDELTDNGQCSLREAVRNANADLATHLDCTAGSGADTINLPASGTPYTFQIAGGGDNAAATGDLDILGDLTIQGAGAPSTIIDAAALDRVFDIRPDLSATLSVQLIGVTIRRGSAQRAVGDTVADGGGIRNRAGGTLRIDSSVVSNSGTPDWGGGVSNNANAAVTVVDSTIRNNGAHGAGGIANRAGGSVEILRRISNNGVGLHGVGGGGILNEGTASLTITDSMIAGNSTGGGGFGSNSAAVSCTPRPATFK